MDFPPEFQRLAFNTLFVIGRTIESEDQFFELILEGLEAQRQIVLRSFLETVLDGEYSNEEIDELWANTGTDAAFFTPGATRQFLNAVRKRLTQDGLS